LSFLDGKSFLNYFYFAAPIRGNRQIAGQVRVVLRAQDVPSLRQILLLHQKG
jgi:hypothetical protein